MIFISILCFVRANAQKSVPISVSLRQTNSNLDFSSGCTDKICQDDEDPAKCGINCWRSNDMFIEYKFRGEQFAIYGSYSNNHGSFNLYLDGDLLDTVSLYKNINTQEQKVVVYTSDILRYDDHTVRIETIGDMIDIYKIVYWPSVKAIRINASELESNWNSESDQIGGQQQYTTDKTNIKSTTILCSKIWVYGNVDTNNGDIILQIDDEKIKITEKSQNAVNGVLIYESDPLPFKKHTIKINKGDNSNDKKSYLRYIYYMPEAIPLLPVPISVSLRQTQNNNLPLNSISNKCTDTQCSDDITQNQPLCGLNCWSPNDMTFEYRFRGEKFSIYASKDDNHGLFDVYLDGTLIETVNLYISDENSPVPKTRVYTSGILQYGDHVIKIQSKNNVIDVYKIVYWPSVNAIRINSSELEATPIWNSQSDQIGGFQQWTTDMTSVKTTSLSCSKVWVYGSTGSEFGNISIQVDDNINIISQNSETEVKGSLLFESNVSENKIHTIKFRKADDSDKKVNLRYIYYVPSPVEQSSVPISVGLQQTENNIDFVQNKCEMNNNQCSDDINVDQTNCGVNCWSPNDMYIQYRFRGEQFAIYGSLDQNHGSFDVFVDGELHDTVDLYRNIAGQVPKVLVYTSKILRYDDHTIRIVANGKPCDLYKVAYWPSTKAIRINASDFGSNDGWNYESDQIGGFQQWTTNRNAKKTATISCSRIWVYGKKGPNNGDIQIKIDDNLINVTEKLDETVQGSLLYESDPFEFGEHKIEINKGDNNANLRTYFRCIYYIPEPIALLPIPISVSLRHTTNNIVVDGKNCEIVENQCSDNITQDQTNCGLNCWGPSGMYFEYQFRGEKFALYGSLDNNHGPIDIKLDGVLHDTVSLYIADEISPNPKVRVYTSGILLYGDHTVRVERKNEPTDMYRLVYWPSINAIRINSSGLVSKTEWNYQSDQIGGFNQWTTSFNNIKTTSFICSKIWIYGAVGTDNGDIKIQVDDDVKVVSESSETTRNGYPILLYESGNLLYDIHKLMIRKDKDDNKRITLRCIYCENLVFPTPTPPPVIYEQLSCSYTDDNKNTLFSDRCDYESKTGNKVIVEIFKTNFSDYKSESDGGAIHIVDGELDCNQIEFNKCQSTNNGAGGAIFVDNSKDHQNNINLDHLTFTGCRAGYGGAIYFQSDISTNKFTIRSCIFASNEAYSEENDDGLFGGSAIFLKTKGTTLIRCKFYNNFGIHGSVKIYNDFSSNLLTSERNHIHFSECSFYSGSIFYANKKNEIENGSQFIEIIKCDFKGKLSNGDYYIDGKMDSKDKKTKFSVKSCTFDHDVQKLINLDLIKDSTQNFEKKNSYVIVLNQYELIILLAASVCLLILVLAFVSRFNNTDEKPSENANDSLEL